VSAEEGVVEQECEGHAVKIVEWWCY